MYMLTNDTWKQAKKSWKETHWRDGFPGPENKQTSLGSWQPIPKSTLENMYVGFRMVGSRNKQNKAREVLGGLKPILDGE